MTPSARFRVLSLGDLPQGLSTFKTTFDRNDSPKNIEHLRWQFERTPVAKQFVALAFPEGDEAVESAAGLYAVFPSVAKVGDATGLAVQSLDTLTDSRFRGRGLFVSLAESVYRRCADDGVRLVYGFPNAHSAPGFFGRLGWTCLDPVPFLIKPLRFSYFLRRLGSVGRWASGMQPATIPLAARTVAHPPGHEMRPLEGFGPGTDRVWQQFRRGVAVAVERDAAYLNWRFSMRPGHQYRSWEYLKPGGETAGFVTVCCLDKHGGRVGYIMELLHCPEVPEIGKALLRHAVRHLAADGAEVVLAWNLPHSPNHPAFRLTGFLPLPEAFRPIELHFGARALDPSIARVVADRRSWYLSYADSDTV